ncbi:MAG TPA: hypothetical protein PKW65_06690 [Bacteroidia bacterium]|nr:hypothetical protein [Bacteroidia bacterium]HRR23671.1 hypothetical protein [Bacteroidia bacterium]HRU17125.1 hypothetical protein [Bacteroidia bacterium]
MEIVTIGNDDFLLRRFPLAHPNYIRPDGSISSFAYQPSSRDIDGLSVDLEKLTTPKVTVQDPNIFGLLKIKGGSIRAVPDLDCVHNPVDGNDAHSLIIGKITKSKKNQLIDASERIPQAELI